MIIISETLSWSSQHKENMTSRSSFEKRRRCETTHLTSILGPFTLDNTVSPFLKKMTASKTECTSVLGVSHYHIMRTFRPISQTCSPAGTSYTLQFSLFCSNGSFYLSARHEIYVTQYLNTSYLTPLQNCSLRKGALQSQIMLKFRHSFAIIGRLSAHNCCFCAVKVGFNIQQAYYTV